MRETKRVIERDRQIDRQTHTHRQIDRQGRQTEIVKKRATS